MIYIVLRFLSFVILKVFFGLQATGRKYLPKKGAFILVSNHVSNLDPIALGVVCPRRLNYMAKDSLFRNRFISWFLDSLCIFPIRRSTADFKAIREAIRRLKKGGALLLFPEGSRSSSEVQSGIGFFASKLNVPVIPAFIKGTDKALPKGMRFMTCTKITVNFGRQIFIEKGLPYQDIAKLVMDNIRQLAC